MKPKEKGVTFVEVMSAMAVVGLVAALSMPNLMRMQIRINEGRAQSALRTIAAALNDYRANQNPPSYPSGLSVLAQGDPPYLTQELVNATGSNTFQGYQFMYHRLNSNEFILVATPPSDAPSGIAVYRFITRGEVEEATGDLNTLLGLRNELYNGNMAAALEGARTAAHFDPNDEPTGNPALAWTPVD